MPEIIKTSLLVADRIPMLNRITPQAQERRRTQERMQRLSKSAGVALVPAEVADMRGSEELLRNSDDHANWTQRRLRIRDRAANMLATRISPMAKLVVVQGVITEADEARLTQEQDTPASMLGAQRLAPALEKRLEAQQKSSRGEYLGVITSPPIVSKDSPSALDEGVIAGFDTSLSRAAKDNQMNPEDIVVVGVIGNHFAARQFDRVQPAHLSIEHHDRGVLFLADQQPSIEQAYWTDTPLATRN